MTLQELGRYAGSFFDFAVVYYVMQLVRCALISYAVLAFVCVLRKTILKNSLFLKGVLWSLFLPVPFMGRMKFFYENKIGVRLFWRWTSVSMNHEWVCRLYACGIAVFIFLLLRKRRKLKKLAAHLEKRELSHHAVIYVTEMPVTPFAFGILRPKIVIPELMLREYSEKELSTIVLHEKMHIRLGHLLLYLWWDILCALFWINPFLVRNTRLFREDMEEICDWATIQKSGGDAAAYGRLLVKSMKALQAGNEEKRMYAAFVDGKEYQKIRRRIKKITAYQSYRRAAAAGVLTLAMLCVLGAAVGIKRYSYARNSELDSILIYDDRGNVLTDDILRQFISYDERYVYVKAEPLEEWMKKYRMQKDFYIVFGGFQKLPGIGGGACSCFYENGGGEEMVCIPYENREGDLMTILYKLL